MAGEKGRIGLIVPANNAAIEYDFWNMVPKGVTIHSTRMPSVKGDEPISDIEIANFKKELSNAVKLLSQVSNVIVYGRTYGSRTHPEIIKNVYDNIIIPEYEAAKSLHKLNAKTYYINLSFFKVSFIAEIFSVITGILTYFAISFMESDVDKAVDAI